VQVPPLRFDLLSTLDFGCGQLAALNQLYSLCEKVAAIMCSITL
jgi:hypothetical protein